MLEGGAASSTNFGKNQYAARMDCWIVGSVSQVQNPNPISGMWGSDLRVRHRPNNDGPGWTRSYSATSVERPMPFKEVVVGPVFDVIMGIPIA